MTKKSWYIGHLLVVAALALLLGCGETDEQFANESGEGEGQDEAAETEQTEEPDHTEAIAETEALIRQLDAALEEYATNHHRRGLYPTDQGEEPYRTTEVVRQLQRHDIFEFTEDQLREVEPDVFEIVDAWGHPLRYRDWRRERNVPEYARNPERFDLSSAGPDGEFGTDADIGNWTE